MAMKWCLVCLAAVAMLGYVCDAQPWGSSPWGNKPQVPNIIQRPTPTRIKLGPFDDEAKPVPKVPKKTTQTKIDFSPPIQWEFPLDPVPESSPTVIPELVPPTPAHSVTAVCREGLVQVTVKRDMFGIGQLIQTADLIMGTCAAQTDNEQALIFQSELQDCGSSLVMEEEELIYIFSFNYVPSPLDGTVIVRTGSADFTVQCHYPRKGNVSSGPLEPTWTPFSATKVAEEALYFSLKLMSEDWKFVRSGESSNHYFLGDVIKMEAAVYQYLHVPLRVHVDACVATLGPDPSSSPRYEFIDNFGCLVDAKLTNSRSTFMTRPGSNKLRFQLEAFMFQKPARGVATKPDGGDAMTLFLTCHLRASTDSHPVDEFHKACSFGADGWVEVLGQNAACKCCDTSCDGRSVTLPPGFEPMGGQKPQRVVPRTRRSDTGSDHEAIVSISVTIGNNGMD